MSAIAPVKSLVFIDAAVVDYQSLIDGLVPGTEAIVLDPAQDGVEQITATLANRSDIQSVHIVSHGSSGSLQLGSTTLNGESLDRYQAQLQEWRSALTEDADILLYGCDVAGDGSGQAFVQVLSQFTKADIAASDDRTGNAVLSGDWDLEFKVGSIESDLAFSEEARDAYAGVLNFGTTTNFSSGANPYSVTVGDVNGDGNLDLATANWSGTASILLGDGSGGFGAATTFAMGANGSDVALSDLNGDNRLDLITTSWNGGTGGNIWVRLGDGSGGFGAATPFTAGSATFGVAVGDFNADGRKDLAIANFSSANVSVLLGNGSGGFGAATNFTAGTTPSGVTIGDFNNDGRQDLVVSNRSSGNVSVLLGDGSGGFGATNNFATGSSGASHVAISDFNSDGRQDLVVSNRDGGNVSVLLGNGSGGFGAATLYPTASGGHGVAAGDFNADGRQDWISSGGFASNNLTLSLGDGSGGFGASTNFGVGSGNRKIALGDFNGDGNADLAVSSFSDNSVSVLLNNSTPPPTVTFTTATQGGNEGNTLTITAQLSVTSSQTVTVPFILSGTANGSDYTITASPITIAAGSTSATITVTLTDDVVSEPSETVVVTMGTPTNAIAGSTTAHTITIAPSDPNTAPGLSDTTVTLVAVNEDAGLPTGVVGTLVSAIVSLGGNVTDSDIGATTGIAITAVDTTNGTWFYTIDNGGTWTALGTVSDTSTQLLAANADTRLYFQPNANYNGTLSNAITFRAWDTTTGTNGSTADPSINGGSTAFSTATDTVAIAITPVNDAPVLTGTATLTAIDEDVLDAANTGTKVSALIDGLTTDVDGDPKAIAITGVDNTKGVWQYSTDGGTIWTNFSATPSDSTATVLGATSFYRASLGTAPTAQGQLSFTNLNLITPAQLGTETFDSSGTILNTDVDSNIYAGYSNFSGANPVNPPLPKLDNVEGYSVSFNLQLLTESHTNSNRAGFSIIVVSNDKAKAIELGFQDGNIFAQKDAGFTADESVAFDTKQSIDYRLEVLGNSYTLFTNNAFILAGALRDYSAFSGAIDPYETPNFIFLGDDSTSAQGSFNLSQVVVQTDNRVRFVPNPNENGNSTINFRAWDTTDGVSAGTIVNASVNGGITPFSSNSTTATITVNSTNDAPTISGTPGVAIAEDSPYTFTPTAADVEGATLTFSITNKPIWASFDTTTGQLSGTPLNSNVGTTPSIVISVSDGTDTAALTAFDLAVTNTNNAPTISGTPGVSIAEDSPYSFTPTAADVDLGGTLTFSITNKPIWATFNPITGQLSGTPLNGDVGTTPGIVISVSDGTDTAALTAFDLAVTNTNDAPTVTNAIADQTTPENAPFTFTLPANTFTDVDVSDTLTYTATLANSSPLPTWLSFNPITRTFSGTPGNTNVGNLDLKVKATDRTGTTAEDSFIVKVSNINQPPAIGIPIPPIPQPVIATQPFTFKIPTGAFIDSDAGDSLTFSASLESGAPLPPWLIFDAKTGSFSGIPDFLSVGNLSLKVNATDAQGLKISQVIKLTIANPTGITGTSTVLIDFSGGTKGVTLKAKKGKLLSGTHRNDVLKGTKGSDRINGGKRSNSHGKDKLYGFNGNDRLKAGGGNDYVEGGRGNDVLLGDKGRDLLLGGEGDDRLLGGKGDDILVGGSGVDTLIGGSGRDMFAFATVNEGKDAIADFNLSEDFIDLRSLFAQSQFAGATSYVRYLKYVQFTQVGASTEIKIDADGSGIGNTFTTLATLNNIGIGAIGSRNFVIS